MNWKISIGLSQGFLGTATFLIPRLRPQYLRVRPDNPRVQIRDLRQPATRTSSTINRVLLLLQRTQSYSITTFTAKPTTTQTVSPLWWWDPTFIPAKTESKRTLQVGRQNNYLSTVCDNISWEVDSTKTGQYVICNTCVYIHRDCYFKKTVSMGEGNKKNCTRPNSDSMSPAFGNSATTFYWIWM